MHRTHVNSWHNITLNAISGARLTIREAFHDSLRHRVRQLGKARRGIYIFFSCNVSCLNSTSLYLGEARVHRCDSRPVRQVICSLGVYHQGVGDTMVTQVTFSLVESPRPDSPKYIFLQVPHGIL